MYLTFLNVLKQYWKPLLIGGSLLLCVFAGWKMNSIYTGYQMNIEERITKQVDKSLSKIEQQGAQNLKETQDLLAKGTTTIVETKVPLIIDRPIYNNVCLDKDGGTILKELREESKRIRGLK